MGQTFLKQQQKMQQTFLDIGEEMGVQKCWDYIQTVLRDPEIMGNKTLARPMLEKVYKALSQKADHYKKAFSFDVEADYARKNWTESCGKSGARIWCRSTSGILMCGSFSITREEMGGSRDGRSDQPEGGC